MNTTQPNIQWLDSLRALATLAVIIIHVSSPLVNMTYGKQMDYWWIGNVLNSLVRFAVPVFLMLSGSTILGKDYPLGAYYKKRMVRVLVPFLFWMVVYWIFRWSMLPAHLQPVEFKPMIHWAINIFLKEGISKHFWYVYMILFLYFLVPFAGKLITKLSNTQLFFLLIIWITVAFLFRSIPTNPYSWANNYDNKILGYLWHSGYLLLGYYLGRLTIKPDRIIIYTAAVFLICATITSVATFYLSQSARKLDLQLYGYFTPVAFFQNAAIFLFIKQIIVQNKFVLLIQKTLSNYSFGIYLVHVMVIGVFFKYGILWTFAHPLISIPLLTLMVLGASLTIIYLLRKLPWGKHVAG